MKPPSYSLTRINQKNIIKLKLKHPHAKKTKTERCHIQCCGGFSGFPIKLTWSLLDCSKGIDEGLSKSEES